MTKEPAGVREPAVAGHFYPADPAALNAEVNRCLKLGAAEGRAPAAVMALIVPHAGYVYSGRVAGSTYAAAELPRTLVILGPNHTGEGVPVAVMSRGVWRTPLGLAAIDEPLADRILQTCSLAEVDPRAHRREHSLEVQIPFLQVKLSEFTFVPICVGTGRLEDLAQLGHDLCLALKGWSELAGIIISSDMSHYIPAEEARVKDMLAIERIIALDPEGLHRVIHEQEISMCGYAPAVAGLAAVREAGAGSARLVAYANSGDASGDYDSVVAYAGLAIA